jgi:hypothetical protein
MKVVRHASGRLIVIARNDDRLQFLRPLRWDGPAATVADRSATAR